jgi:hypothetical protein
MVTCMNDPGPILDTNPSSKTFGQKITDPYFNAAYSTFCYENPFMPADATYLDTPVIPISAFAEGYNPPDCAYPDTTPAIKEVHTGDGPGPWMHSTGNPLYITALGDVVVPNHAYSGPAATTAPYNQKTVTRHYGFGNTAGHVTIGGIPAGIVSWSDTQITVTVPDTLPFCQVQTAGHRAPGNQDEHCGQLVITNANGQQSVDTVTVVADGCTVYNPSSNCFNGPPIYVNGENAANNAIQSAIDAARPGDIIIVGPGIYHEMLLMWKPVRLQGAGAGSVNVIADAAPAGTQLQPWRRQVNCLFGLALNGGFINNNPLATNPNGSSDFNPYDV